MGLFGRGQTTVGLDIGAGLIKVAVIAHAKGKDPTLAKVGFTAVANEAIVDGEVVDAGAVASAVRELLGSLGVKTKKVVTAIGGRDVITKVIKMDRMDPRKPDEVRQMLRWEAENHVPFDVESVELDFEILDPEDDANPQMNVMLVAAKRDLVESRMALLGECGLDAEIVDFDGFALHNAFELNYPEAMRGTVGLANIGYERTTFNILENGTPVMTRDLNIGTRRLREEMQRERGIGAEEAERILRGTETSDELESFLKSRGEELAVGIERASAFLANASRSGQALGRLYTTGGGSRIPGLDRVLSERLRVPVERANPTLRLNMAPGVFDAYDVDEVAPLLMVPIGLALRTAD